MPQATHVSLGVHFKLGSSNQQAAFSGNKQTKNCLKYSLRSREGQKWVENATQTRHRTKRVDYVEPYRATLIPKKKHNSGDNKE